MTSDPTVAPPATPFFGAEHEQLRDTLRRFIAERVLPQADAWEQQGQVPRAVLREMGALGLLGIRYPACHGGSELDTLATVVLAEELGRSTYGGFAVTVLVHTDMASPHLVNAGTPEQIERYLADVIAGRRICAIAMTEADAGSDLAGMRTRARRDGDHWVLDGAKMFITNGVHGDLFFVAAKTGALVLIETFPVRVRREGSGAGLKRLPYLSEMAAASLSHIDTVILAGAAYPVAFFALPGRPTTLAPDNARIVEIAAPGFSIERALTSIAALVQANVDLPRAGEAPVKPNDGGAIDPMALAQSIAATLPDNAIVCDESNTAGLFCYEAAASAAAHDWLTLTGGAIGQGLPLATGAAIACPDRRVVALEADGSALYTIQALWTQAREGLNITNVILNNGAYAILRLEMMRAGVNELSEAAGALFDLKHPAIDFCALARGFGVPAERVETAGKLVAALERSFATPGPALIEVMIR